MKGKLNSYQLITDKTRFAIIDEEDIQQEILSPPACQIPTPQRLVFDSPALAARTDHQQ